MPVMMVGKLSTKNFFFLLCASCDSNLFQPEYLVKKNEKNKINGGFLYKTDRIEGIDGESMIGRLNKSIFSFGCCDFRFGFTIASFFIFFVFFFVFVRIARNFSVLLFEFVQSFGQLSFVQVGNNFGLCSEKESQIIIFVMNDFRADQNRRCRKRLTACCTLKMPPYDLMVSSILSSASCNTFKPSSFSIVCVVSTYSGGAIKLILTCSSSVDKAMPARRAALTASMPS